MPSKDEHLKIAKDNQATLEHLQAGDGVHAPWVVTLAFYQALHLCEAVLFADNGKHTNGVRHTSSHKRRDKLLKKTNNYQQIYKMYGQLKQASLVARYMSKPGDCSLDLFSKRYPSVAIDRLINEKLSGLKKSVGKKMGVSL